MYSIFRPTTGEYVALRKDGSGFWSDINRAHRFATKQKAENFLKQNYSHTVKDPAPKSEVAVVFNHTVKCDITDEQASKYINDLPQTISNIYAVGDMVSSLVSYHSAQVGQADKAIEDLLHKIEFTNVGVVDGYKYYKAIQEVRKKRRAHKDICAMLTAINQSGVVSSASNLKKTMEAPAKERVYTPRASDSLFTDDKSVSLDAALRSLVKQVATPS